MNFVLIHEIAESSFVFHFSVFIFGASIIGNTRHILKTTARRCQQIAAKNKLKQTTDTRRMMTSSWKQKNQTVGVIIDIIHMPGPGRLVNRQRTMMATIISTVQARHGSESCGLANRWLAKASKGLRFALIWVNCAMLSIPPVNPAKRLFFRILAAYGNEQFAQLVPAATSVPVHVQSSLTPALPAKRRELRYLRHIASLQRVSSDIPRISARLQV